MNKQTDKKTRKKWLIGTTIALVFGIAVADIGYYGWKAWRQKKAAETTAEGEKNAETDGILETEKKNKRICRSDGKTCGDLLESLYVKWDKGNPEMYVKNNDDIYEILPEPVAWLAYSDWGALLYKVVDNKVWLKEKDWTGNPVIMDDDKIIILWNGKAELFNKNAQGVYALASEQPKTAKVKHPGWSSDFVFLPNNRFAKATDGDPGKVLTHTDTEITVKWDNWGTETFIKDKNGTYQLKKKEK